MIIIKSIKEFFCKLFNLDKSDTGVHSLSMDEELKYFLDQDTYCLDEIMERFGMMTCSGELDDCQFNVYHRDDSIKVTFLNAIYIFDIAKDDCEGMSDDLYMKITGEIPEHEYKRGILWLGVN